MCYKQSFAANSFLAGMKFAVHIYLLLCILMSLTGLLKWNTANKNMFSTAAAVSIPCDKLDIDLYIKETMFLWQINFLKKHV